ncbi:hypothetical protein MAHJHV55_54630 [Mycobacterium avium subsp. hominissuis]
MTVVGPDGNVWSTGEPTVQGAVGSPVDHTLPSGPTTVIAAKVVCSCSLKVALTRCGPVVSATFNEQLQTTFAAMTVVGPDGNVWSTGEPTVQGAEVTR